MEKRISIAQKCQYFYTLNENRTIYSCVLLTILCSIIIHLIACNYVLLCIILWAHASSLNLRDTSDRLTKYSQLKRAAFQLEPLIKSVFEVSKHWHLRTIGFECCAYFQKKFGCLLSEPLSYVRVASNNLYIWLYKGERRRALEREE